MSRPAMIVSHMVVICNTLSTFYYNDESFLCVIVTYDIPIISHYSDNNHGQLGVGSRLACKTPQVLTGVEDVKLIATGADHSLAVTG